MPVDFVVTELRRIGQGTYADENFQFRWTVAAHTAPRGGWETKLHVQTNRTDYPGDDQEPTEQVLAAYYEPFTLSGAWDDRYAGIGFAERTRDAFEAMVIRRNVCRIEFGALSFTGLITDFTHRLEKDWGATKRISYEFTVSPHSRLNPEREARPALSPAAIANPTEYVGQVSQRVVAAQEIHQAGPAAYIQDDLYTNVGDVLAEIAAKMVLVQSVIDGRVLVVAGNGATSLARLATTFASVAVTASRMKPLLRGVKASTHLNYTAVIPVLEFEIWYRGLEVAARVLRRQALAASREFQRRAQPGVSRYYRPLKGESLYGISTQFYNTPHRWRLIAERNNLTGILLTGTEFLIIPEAR
jgi:hypothetical protein